MSETKDLSGKILKFWVFNAFMVICYFSLYFLTLTSAVGLTEFTSQSPAVAVSSPIGVMGTVFLQILFALSGVALLLLILIAWIAGIMVILREELQEASIQLGRWWRKNHGQREYRHGDDL